MRCYVSIKVYVVEGGICVFCSRAQHGHILYMALIVTVGVCSRILKLPELLRVPLGPNLLVFIAFSGDIKLFIPGDHKVGSQCKHRGVSPLHNKQSALFCTEGVDSRP